MLVVLRDGVVLFQCRNSFAVEIHVPSTELLDGNPEDYGFFRAVSFNCCKLLPEHLNGLAVSAAQRRTEIYDSLLTGSNVIELSTTENGFGIPSLCAGTHSSYASLKVTTVSATYGPR